MKVKDRYYYYIHRGGLCYEVVYSDIEINTYSNPDMYYDVFSTRGSKINTPARDIYHRVEDVRKQVLLYSYEELVPNCDYKTIEDYLSYLRGVKIDKVLN